MTPATEHKITSALREIRPRDGFASELLAALTEHPHRLHSLDPVGERSRTRRMVASAVAGVISATGVAYIAARRHHRGAA